MHRTSVVTDDVRSSREVAACWLREFGYATKLKADGDAAWDIILEIEPDLVVTDIEMPGKCGLELLLDIREHSNERLRTIPVIVISSLQDAALEETALRLGATAVLEKPLVKTEFGEVIGQIHRGDLQPVSREKPIVDKAHCGPISPTLRRLIERIDNR